METVKSRSESPFPKSKTKDQPPDISENGDTVVEQIKTKKKSLRLKQKAVLAVLMETENGDSGRNGNDLGSEGVEMTEKNDNDKENNHDNENDNEKKSQKAEEKDDEKENEPCNNVHESLDNVSNGKKLEGDVPEESTSNDVSKQNNMEEGNGDNATLNETESSAKKDILENDVDPEAETVEEKTNGDMHTSTEVQECSSVAGTSYNGVNGNNDHHEDSIQASPDMGVKEEGFFSHKISNFLGKWNSTAIQEEKQDSEISSSKKGNDVQSCGGEILIHPYLSKVSGRRGIKERMNSSLSSLGSVQEEMKTPTNSSNLLDDSFRVRTNPPRLNSSELQENPTLRKFKGKRCLNASDEREDEEEDDFANKRRKLESEAREAGLLGDLLWSPFRKNPPPPENALKLNTESKLSRFLSPFWFWKKTAERQKGK